MNFNVGDFVTRNSYNNDILFKIITINGNICFLKGVDLRLTADSTIDDLVKVENSSISDDKIIEDSTRSISLDRTKYFYLPGKILHVDGDDEYLERCMKFYNNMHLKANGISLSEVDIPYKIYNLLNEFQPDIVVITGHDAFYSKKRNDSINNYQNTSNFIDAVKESRKFEKNQDKLIIIAGACQSNYEELIKAGANFASSPKRINIHALDPAIIASSVALADKSKPIDIVSLVEKTKYGKDGIGGIITNGTMYVGYPR